MSIRVVYSPLHKKHSPKKELFNGELINNPEVPDRVENILRQLRNQGVMIAKAWSFRESWILSLHTKRYLNFLKSSSIKTHDEFFLNSYSFDSYTPITHGAFDAAKSSVNVALSGAKRLVLGEMFVYSLCRPPGHHARKSMMGGYCFFNNAAIAANYLSKRGRVAVLDVDYHHGNGTQEMFYKRSDILFVSIHAEPRAAFPHKSGYSREKGEGDGKRYNFNFPLPLNTGERKYQQTLIKALEKVSNFSPEYLVVSLGFDTYIGDPICKFSLTRPFYKKMANKIAALNLPTLFVQEGGYDTKSIGKLAESFFSGLP
ncbi:MAG: histone deacetylase family protein [Patescibacteria group bacterium]